MTLPKMDEGVDPEVARELQLALDALNRSDPPDYDVPHFLASYRHPCTRARQSREAGRGVSTNIDCKEIYSETQDGTHALLYKEGTCPKCRATARSRVGRVVLTSERPPVEGRVAR